MTLMTLMTVTKIINMSTRFIIFQKFFFFFLHILPYSILATSLYYAILITSNI